MQDFTIEAKLHVSPLNEVGGCLHVLQLLSYATGYFVNM